MKRYTFPFVTFRVWNSLEKTFIYFDMADFLNPDVSPARVEILKLPFMLDFDNYSTQTPYQDKNGNDLWTGDIIECGSGEDRLVEMISLSPIHAGIVPFVRGCDSCTNPEPNEVVKIGNRWENKELLKDVPSWED